MEKIKEIANKVLENSQSQTSHKTSTKTSIPASFTPDEITKIADAMLSCAVVQRTYGKQGNDIKAAVKIFTRLLSGYPIGMVMEAFDHWIRNENQFPTPADIKRLLVKQYEQDGKYRQLINYRESGGRLNDEQRGYINRIESLKEGVFVPAIEHTPELDYRNWDTA